MFDLPFVYREKLNIPHNINFGLELEIDKIDPDKVYKLVRRVFGNSWIVKDDKSLTKGENAEIVSPVLNDTKETWILLKKLGELLDELKGDYNNCSFQVNFDGSMLPNEKDKVSFLKLYAMYEDIIYGFSKSGDIEYRYSLAMYAAPIILHLKGMLPVGDNAAVEAFSNQKRYGIAFKNSPKDLIEFRTPNMTSDPIYWQNYINTFYHLLNASIKFRYDKREVDRYIEEYSKIYILESYEILKEEKAKKFVKTIFDSTIDKSNFMHQYMGR